jgi:branched-chain amino acid transport system ATP-binding protein
MSFFVINDLSLAFGGVQALRNLSFSVNAGEVFAIIGPNGAGKTSVLNVVTRVFDPDSGHVVFEGQDITRVARHRVVEHGIARTFQNIELFENATVLDNVMLGRHGARTTEFFGELLNLPRVVTAERAHREAAEEIMDALDLAPYRSQPVVGLPYGVRKMVELARALATQPRLLLLDEPASGLNPEETHDLAFWLEDIRRDRGVTIVMVEHDMSLVSRIADRVLCMNAGAALALGTPEQVNADPAVIEAYLGVATVDD